MEWIKKNPEKIVALIAGLVGLGFGVQHILSVVGLPDQFVTHTLAPKAEFPSPENDSVLQSAAILKSPFNWSDKAVELAGGAHKLVPLFRSVVIIEKDGKLFDMADPTEEPIRPPVENEWLLKHRLDYLFSGVLEADPDDDGFSSVDEWKSKTSPVDAASHPPYWLKLMFVDRKQKNFSIKFAADNDPQFQFNIVDQGRKKTEMAKVGDTFYDGRFTVIGYEKKEGMSPSGIKGNQSTVKLKDHTSGAELVIVFSKETNYPTFFAQFNFTLDPAQKEFFVRVGDPITLLKEPGVTYKLVDIDPTGSFATLGLPDGKTAKLDKGVLPAVPDPVK